jgi:hypothetical protein
MYYIGPEPHEKMIGYRVKDPTGCMQQEGKIGST